MAIAFVKNLGTAQSKTTGTALTFAIPTLITVAAGNNVIICFAMDPAAGAVSCTDSGPHTYVLLGDRTQGSGTTGVRVVLFSAHLTNGLTGGLHSITVSHPSAAARALTIAEFSSTHGATTTDALDGSATVNGTTGSPTLTKSDTNLRERLFVAAIGKEAPTNTITQPSGWTVIPAIATSGGSANTNIQVSGAWRISSEVRPVTYAPTHSSTATWAGVLHALRDAPTIGVERLVSSVLNADGSYTQVYITYTDNQHRFSLRTAGGNATSKLVIRGDITDIDLDVPPGEKTDYNLGGRRLDRLTTFELRAG